MSLVLRLKTGDAAPQQQAAPLASETLTGVVMPPPEPELALEWASLTPAAGSHLAPCPRCGSPNGLSALTCWHCEATLSPHESFQRWLAPWPAAPALIDVPPRLPAYVDEALPVATSAQTGLDPMADRSIAAVSASEPAWMAGR